MFVAANRFRINEGYGEAFVDLFEDSMTTVDEQPGFVRFDLLAPADDGDTYIAQTYWESREAFEAWTNSDAFESAHDRDPPSEMFDGHPSLELYEAAFSRE